MEGNSKGWFSDGQMQFEYNFQNDLEHGVCSEWNVNGQKISELRFEKGVPVMDLLTGNNFIPVNTPNRKEAPPVKENAEKTNPIPSPVNQDVTSTIEPSSKPTETNTKYDPFSKDNTTAEGGESNPVNNIPDIPEASSPEIPVASPPPPPENLPPSTLLASNPS